jgi:hypothetical protein
MQAKKEGRKRTNGGGEEHELVEVDTQLESYAEWLLTAVPHNHHKPYNIHIYTHTHTSYAHKAIR